MLGSFALEAYQIKFNPITKVNCEGVSENNPRNIHWVSKIDVEEDNELVRLSFINMHGECDRKSARKLSLEDHQGLTFFGSVDYPSDINGLLEESRKISGKKLFIQLLINKEQFFAGKKYGILEFSFAPYKDGSKAFHWDIHLMPNVNGKIKAKLKKARLRPEEK